MEFNPSDHPRASTIFLSKSQTDVREKRKSLFINHHPPGQIARKYSSCSTIFLDDSTVSQPNLKYTIKCVALAIYYHIKNRDPDGRMLLDIFDENLHPLSKSEVPPDYDKHNPEQKQIYRFVRTLFSAAQLTAECAIVTLHPPGQIARKYSSCSTIFLDDSTVSQPNLKYTIKCVALAIYYHIKNRDPDGRMLLDIFDENLHPLSKSEVPPDCDKHNPEQKQIYRFVWTLFSAAQLTAECAIVTLLPEAEQPPLPRAPTATMFCFATAMESANHGPSLCHCEPKKEARPKGKNNEKEDM
ncbi:uncharacterized protein isoform X2 [Castor canadensis]|uniref:Uncharacterized protein isoform X2 n=1 Tax=Castor canadensis TaxID=51338 RepID=A0AC58L5S6_CASCN